MTETGANKRKSFGAFAEGEWTAVMASPAKQIQRTEQFCASLFANAPREFRLVAACCCWPPESAKHNIASFAASVDLNWSRVVSLSERHRVTGLVSGALRNVAAVPQPIQRSLAQRAAHIQRQNLAHIAVSLRVSRALQAEGIPFVILKGAPLAQLAFGNASARHMRDVDLLVKPQVVERTRDVLRSLGFEANSEVSTLTPRQARLWRRYRKHESLAHEGSGVEVELHWRAFDNTKLDTSPEPAVQWVEVAQGQSLPTLATEELLLALCVHGAGHAWFRMKWLADVAALMQRMRSENWSKFLSMSRRLDLDRAVEQAFLLSAGLFGVDTLRFLPASTRTGRWLAGVGRGALLIEEATSNSPESDFVPRGQMSSRFLLRRSWRYRIEEARVMAASPADWRALPLPERLQFAYPLLRAPLWVRRRWFPRRVD